MSTAPAGPEAPDRPDRARFFPALLAIAVVALLVRIAFTLLVDPSAGYPSDADNYHRLGALLADGHGYLRPLDFALFGYERATAEYPPLLPFLLGGLSLVGIDSVEGQELALAFVGAGTVVLIGLLGRRLAGDRAGLGAATIAALYPMLFQADAVLMTESLAALLVSACLLLAFRALDSPTPARCAALGAAVGLGALARSELILLAPLLVVPLAVSIGQGPRTALRLAAVGLCATALVLVPWTARNLLRFDALVPVTNNLGTVLDGANCDLTYYGAYTGSWRSRFGEGGASDFPCFEGFHIEDPAFEEAEAAATHRRAGLSYAGDHTRRLPLVALARLGRTWGLFRVSQQVDLESLEGRDRAWQMWGTRSYWLLIPFAVAGAALLRRRRVPLWPLLAPILLVTMTTVVTYGNQRFRSAAEPSLVVLAGVGATALAGRALPRRAAPLA